jgi:hypothetical protein
VRSYRKYTRTVRCRARPTGWECRRIPVTIGREECTRGRLS